MIHQLVCYILIIIIDKFSVMATNITGPTPQVDYSKLLTSPNYFGDNIGANPVSRPKNAESGRFTTSKTTVKKRKRTTPARIYLEEDCDYLAHYCLKAYETGQVCGRTLYYVYSTFENYCMLDYVNCMERYEVWQILHMGACYTVKAVSEYMHYPYQDDYFLDNYYVIENM